MAHPRQGKQKKGDADMLELLALAEKNTPKDMVLAHNAVKDIFRLNSSLRVRIPLDEKRKLCKNCFTYLKPGATSTVRVRNGRVIITCKVCKNVKRLQYRKTKR